MSLLELPEELIEQLVVTACDVRAVLRLACTCRALYQLLLGGATESHDELWRRLVLRDFSATGVDALRCASYRDAYRLLNSGMSWRVREPRAECIGRTTNNSLVMAVEHTGDAVFASSYDGEVYRGVLRGEAKENLKPYRKVGARCMALSIDDAAGRLAYGFDAPAIGIDDVATGQQIHQRSLPSTSGVWQCYYRGDLISYGADGLVEMFDARSDRSVHKNFTSLSGAFYECQFTDRHILLLCDGTFQAHDRRKVSSQTQPIDEYRTNGTAVPLALIGDDSAVFGASGVFVRNYITGTTERTRKDAGSVWGLDTFQNRVAFCNTSDTALHVFSVPTCEVIVSQPCSLLSGSLRSISIDAYTAVVGSFDGSVVAFDWYNAPLRSTDWSTKAELYSSANIVFDTPDAANADDD